MIHETKINEAIAHHGQSELLSLLREAEVVLGCVDSSMAERCKVAGTIQAALEENLGPVHWDCAASEDYEGDCEVCNAIHGA